MAKPRLLIVDDEPDMLDFLERVFRHDYEVARAQSVEEALPLLQRGPIDLLITDCRMPRRTGVELLEIVAARCPKAIRVLLTGYGELTGELSNPAARADASISKPVDAAGLKQAIAQAVAAREATG